VLEAAVFQPLILGKETGLHPIAVILALLSAGQLLGLFGVLLAIPLASTVKILFEDYVVPMFEEVADLTRIRRRPEEAAPPPP
jgi:predicted PurR-regulated permease PerM